MRGSGADAADRVMLTRWADEYADGPVWDEIESDGLENWSKDSIHLVIIQGCVVGVLLSFGCFFVGTAIGLYAIVYF